MKNLENQAFEVVVDGMRRAIRSSALTIERVTKRLDKYFEGLEATNLPEYKQAIDAINNYANVLVSHFLEKSKEHSE